LKFGKMHGIVFVPNVGNIGPTLTNSNSGTEKAVKMTVDEPWVLIETTDKFKKPAFISVPIEYFTHILTDDKKA